jgi:predicted N-acetyltransferase YhbS
MVIRAEIKQLAEHPEWLPVVADWIYSEWWASVDGMSVGEISDLLRAHLVLDQIPLTLVASLDRRPVGTVTLLAHDEGTEQWPHLSPWLAALYVVPRWRRRGIGGALVSATAARAGALGATALYLLTTEREDFYGGLGWQVMHRNEDSVVMFKLPSRPSPNGLASPG